MTKYSIEETKEYEESLKIYRDYKNTIDTAFDEGINKVAKNLKKEGIDIELIIKVTGLTKEQIDTL